MQQAGKNLDGHRSWWLGKWQKVKGQTTEVSREEEKGGAETLTEGISFLERNRDAPPRKKGQMDEGALLRGTE